MHVPISTQCSWLLFKSNYGLLQRCNDASYDLSRCYSERLQNGQISTNWKNAEHLQLIQKILLEKMSNVRPSRDQIRVCSYEIQLTPCQHFGQNIFFILKISFHFFSLNFSPRVLRALSSLFVWIVLSGLVHEQTCKNFDASISSYRTILNTDVNRIPWEAAEELCSWGEAVHLRNP